MSNPEHKNPEHKKTRKHILKTLNTIVKSLNKFPSFANLYQSSNLNPGGASFNPPNQQFQTNYQKQTQINYGDTNNWHQIPTVNKGDIDIFVIHPTITFGHQFSKLDSKLYATCYEKMISKDYQLLLNPSDLVEQNYNVFIPKYQSAGIQYEEKVYLKNAKSTDALIDELGSTLAGQSIIDALDFYLNNHWQGKKWAILGYSQGSILGAGVVIDYLSKYHKGDMLEKLQHIYLAGFSPTQKRLDFWNDKIGFKFSQTPTDTQTISAWACAFKEEIDQFNNDTAVNSGAIITTNPITWTTEGETSASDDLINLKMNGVYYRFQNQLKYITKPNQGYTVIDAGELGWKNYVSEAEITFCHHSNLAVAHLLELQKLSIRKNMELRLGLKGI